MGGPLDKYHTIDNMLFRSFIESINRFAVPVFFMVSGAIHLNRQYEINRQFFFKIFLKYIMPTFFAIAFYKAIDYSFEFNVNYFQELFTQFNSKSGYHLWFMIVYIGFVLSLPILVPIARDKKVEIYFIILWVFFTVINDTIIRFYKDFTPPMMQNPLFLMYTGYFFLGHYLHRNMLNSSKLFIFYTSIVAIFSFLGICFATYYASIAENRFINYYTIPPSPYLLFYSSSIFILFKLLISIKSNHLHFFAKYTFFIYLLHLALVRMIKTYLENSSFGYNLTFAAIAMPFIVYIMLFALFYTVDSANKIFWNFITVDSNDQ
ncbi:MAG: acyltransferase family protein [Desulfovibrionaceae bacterium]|nr:acyltransferase family protein [Desulfovibrionaceae bacterium]MBF0515337.1 acyltransferase family protein [Desulfovibrionaceae bacterium]